MAELADAHGSGPCGATRAGSSPVIRIKISMKMTILQCEIVFLLHTGNVIKIREPCVIK